MVIVPPLPSLWRSLWIYTSVPIGIVALILWRFVAFVAFVAFVVVAAQRGDVCGFSRRTHSSQKLPSYANFSTNSTYDVCRPQTHTVYICEEHCHPLFQHLCTCECRRIYRILNDDIHENRLTFMLDSKMIETMYLLISTTGILRSTQS